MAAAEDLGVEDVLHVLENIFMLEGVTRRDEFEMLCPSHDDVEPSCGVNLKTGYYNCWSCPASGDLVELGHVVLKKPRKEVRDSLKVKDPSAVLMAVRRRLRTRREAARPITPRDNIWRPKVPPADSYSPGPQVDLVRRGFTKDTLRRWGVRYVNRTVIDSGPADDQEFVLEHCFAIPTIEDEKIRLWTYGKTKSSPKWMPKYLNTPGVDKQRFWFGWDLIEDYDEVAVTEGQLDAMWLDQHGIPALANLGSGLKNEKANFRKIERLARFKKVVLFMDRDSAGHIAVAEMGRLLHARGVACSVVRYPPWAKGPKGERASDPQDLDRLDLQILYWRAIPYIAWRLGERQ